MKDVKSPYSYYPPVIQSEKLLCSLFHLYQNTCYRHFLADFILNWDPAESSFSKRQTETGSSFIFSNSNATSHRSWKFVIHGLFGFVIPVSCLLMMACPSKFELVQLSIAATLSPTVLYVFGFARLLEKYIDEIVLVFRAMKRLLLETGQVSF